METPAAPGSALRRARLDRNLSQIELAAALGKRCSSQLCEWEKGKRPPSFPDALALERFFGRSVMPVEAWGFDRETARRANAPRAA